MTFRELFKELTGIDVFTHNKSSNIIPCLHKFPILEEKDPNVCRRMIDCKACWEREAPEKTVEMLIDGRDKFNLRLYMLTSYFDKKKAADAANSVREEVNDNVSPPSHYCHGGIECIDAIESATHDLTGAEAVLTGQVIKYLWRWKWKNGVEDLRKARFYLDRLIGKVSLHEK